MSRRTVHVYTGPTLDAAAVTAVLPEAVVHPPVAAADLLRLDAARGDVVVIVDGYFQQSRSVRHKEILLLLERGVEVWGAGSMGALRAAELHRFGMRGVGAVFRLYVRGVIEGDDEVGVTHGPAERGYPVVADALVNIRCTLRQAVRDGLVDAAAATHFAAAAQATPFQQRTPTALLGAAITAGMDAADAARIGALLTQRRVDVKRLDALRALRRVRDGLSARDRKRTAPPAVKVSDSAHLRVWHERTRETGEGGVTDRLALAACQLLAADYPQFAAPVALRTLAALASPDPAAVHALSDAELLGRSTNPPATNADLARDEWLSHLRREERLSIALGGRPDSEQALAALVLAAADARGVLHAADAHRWTPRWLRAAEHGTTQHRLRAACRSLAIAPGLGVREPFTVALKLAGHFPAARRLAAAALAFNDEVAAAHAEFAVHLLDAARVTAFLAERWSVHAAELDLELADRGFSGREEFLEFARLFYMAAKFRPAMTAISLCTEAAAA